VRNVASSFFDPTRPSFERSNISEILKVHWSANDWPILYPQISYRSLADYELYALENCVEYPSLRNAPARPRTKSILHHNVVPVQLGQKRFMIAGELVTR